MSKAKPMASERRIARYLRGRRDFTPRQLRREYHKWRRGLGGQLAHFLDYPSRTVLADAKMRPTPRQRRPLADAAQEMRGDG